LVAGTRVRFFEDERSRADKPAVRRSSSGTRRTGDGRARNAEKPRGGCTANVDDVCIGAAVVPWSDRSDASVGCSQGTGVPLPIPRFRDVSAGGREVALRCAARPIVNPRRLSLVLQAAARRDRTRGVDRGTAFFNRGDFPLLVNHKCGAAGQIRGAKHIVELHHVTLVVGEHRKFGVQLFRPMVESRYEIATDGQNLRVRIVEFANTRLVGGKLFRSTTSKRGREER